MKFVLISQPRSGTHMLATSLESHCDISMDGEIFNRSIYPGVDDKKPLDVINQTFKHNNGFILHLTQSKPAQVEVAKMDGIKFICLYRLNHLERYVSTQQANIHNRWQVYDGQEKPPINKIIIDPDDLLRNIDDYEGQWAKFRDMISLKPSLVLNYEDLIKNYSVTMGKIFKFLHVRDKEVTPKTIKIGGDLRESVANYDEMVELVNNHIR